MKKIPFRKSTPPRGFEKPSLGIRKDTNLEMLRALEAALERKKPK